MSSPQKPIEEWTLETFRKVIDLNLTAAFICTREAVRQFKKQTPIGGQEVYNFHSLSLSPALLTNNILPPITS
jgi:NAD(P)-dependent dehydrogenase (short-subunit alcohol dehydrogenase family)